MLNRRHLLLAAGAAVLAPRAYAQPAATGRLYDEIFEAILQVSPITASGLGYDKGPRAGLKSRLNDKSAAGRMDVFQPLIDALPRLKAVDRGQLAGVEASRYDTVLWSAERAREAAAFPYGGVDSYDYPVPYVTSQLTGSYQRIPDFLDSNHAIETREDAEVYLARLQAFGHLLSCPVAVGSILGALRQGDRAVLCARPQRLASVEPAPCPLGAACRNRHHRRRCRW